MICARCNSSNIIFINETETEVKNRGCFKWLLWIFLAIITFGVILLIIPAITNSKIKTKTNVIAVCQNCGNKWHV